MNQATTKPTQCPPARQPRIKRAAPPLGTPSAYQVGRVRAWLYRNAGVSSIALCWAFAFAAIAVPAGPERLATAAELTAVAVGFLGFGVGWIAGHGKGKR